MQKNQPNESSEEVREEVIAPPYFIVPGRGHVEAKDLTELEKKLKKLDEQEAKS